MSVCADDSVNVVRNRMCYWRFEDLKIGPECADLLICWCANDFFASLVRFASLIRFAPLRSSSALRPLRPSSALRPLRSSFALRPLRYDFSIIKRVRHRLHPFYLKCTKHPKAAAGVAGISHWLIYIFKPKACIHGECLFQFGHGFKIYLRKTGRPGLFHTVIY